MPEDLPKAVMILLWLLSGTIIFGALLMKSTLLNSFVFLVLFFGVPVLGYWLIKRKRQL
jgi:Flp pilus assembly protein TadB